MKRRSSVGSPAPRRLKAATSRTHSKMRDKKGAKPGRPKAKERVARQALKLFFGRSE